MQFIYFNCLLSLIKANLCKQNMEKNIPFVAMSLLCLFGLVRAKVHFFNYSFFILFLDWKCKQSKKFKYLVEFPDRENCLPAGDDSPSSTFVTIETGGTALDVMIAAADQSSSIPINILW